jgi:hypothetical protein
MCFVAILYYQKVQIGKLFAQYLYFGNFGQNFGIWPLGDPILVCMGQIPKITPEMDYLPHEIAKNELLHDTLCGLVENLKFS